MNNLKIKVDDIDVDKFKVVPEDLKKVSDLISIEVAKNTKFNILNEFLMRLLQILWGTPLPRLIIINVKYCFTIRYQKN